MSFIGKPSAALVSWLVANLTPGASPQPPATLEGPDPAQAVVRPLSIERFLSKVEEYVAIYMAAMRYDSRLRASRIAAWEHDSTLDGFHAFEAVDPRYPDVPLGVCYGHNADWNSWWHREIARGVRTRHPAGIDASWLMHNYFEVSEIHVRDEAQSAGIGRKLLRTLIGSTDRPCVVLSTPEVPHEANRAFSLYRSPEFGFRDLLRHFYFYGDNRPFAVLYTQREP